MQVLLLRQVWRAMCGSGAATPTTPTSTCPRRHSAQDVGNLSEGGKNLADHNSGSKQPWAPKEPTGTENSCLCQTSFIHPEPGHRRRSFSPHPPPFPPHQKHAPPPPPPPTPPPAAPVASKATQPDAWNCEEEEGTLKSERGGSWVGPASPLRSHGLMAKWPACEPQDVPSGWSQMKPGKIMRGMRM